MLTKERILNLLRKPMIEWNSIANETNKPIEVFLRFFLPLLGVPIIALVFGYGLVGKTSNDGFLSFAIKGWHVGFQKSITYLISTPVALFVSAWVIDHMAPVFRSERNLDRTLILIMYSWTPVLLVGVFYFFPVMDFMFYPGIIAAFALLWFGLPVMKNTPPASKSVYFLMMVIVLVSLLAIFHQVIFTPLIGAFWMGNSGLPGVTL
jgi:hypothetical protein